ncbi:MAG: clostripain-related cysteine peptidase [Kofleriaceae bacterium]
MLFGCNAGGGDDEPKHGPDATWTVMVYGHGDHNLSGALQVDIDEMKRATLRNNVTAIVLADFDASQGAGHPTGSYWLKISNGGVETIEMGAEQNLDDPNVLTTSIERAFMLAPADRYGLVLWDHGGGWEGGFGGDTQNGAADGPGMPIPVVADAVRDAFSRTGIDYIDLFAFDTCLLAGAESAAEFVGLADVYIANGELDYGDGLDYTALLSYLSEHPETTYASLATADAAAYRAHHDRELIDQLLHAHVALRLDDMAEVMGDARALVDTVDNAAGALEVGRAMFAAAPHYHNSEFTPDGSGNAGLHDIGQVAEVLADSNDDDIASAARSLRSSLDGMVLASSLGQLRERAQIGINVELTTPFDASPDKLTDYRAKAAAWTKASRWDQLIESVASFADERAPDIAASIIGPATVTFSTDDDDIADATFELAEFVNGLEYDYGFVGSGALRPGVELDMTWNGEVNAMQTSAGLEPVYAAPWGLSYAANGTPQFTLMYVPGVLQEAGSEALVMLLFDSETGDAPLFTLFDPMSGTWATRNADEFGAGVVFRPIVPTYDPNGNESIVRLGSIPVTASGLLVYLASMPQGPYRLNLFAKDLWANEALYAFDIEAGSSVARTGTPRPVTRSRTAWFEQLVRAERAGAISMALSSKPARRPPVLHRSIAGARSATRSRLVER